MKPVTRDSAYEDLAVTWTNARSTVQEIAADIATVTGRPVPDPEADDLLGHLTDAEVLAVHRTFVGRTSSLEEES